MKNKKLISLILILLLLALTLVSCGEKDKSTDSDTVEVNNDGTPIEVEPYTEEDGTPYINTDGQPVYKVKGADENGKPVLVINSQTKDENGEFVFYLQAEKDGVISTVKETKDGADVPATTLFKGNASDIPSEYFNTTTQNNTTKATTAATTKAPTATKPGETTTTTIAPPAKKEFTDKIELGGIFGTVTREKKERYSDRYVYKGNFNSALIGKLVEPRTYPLMKATFERGFIIPAKIGAYDVEEILYTRFYEYIDSYDNQPDWYTERGTFKQGNTLVFLEDNATFSISEEEMRELYIPFLIELK